MLVDTDGDGQMDRSNIFSENLMFPNGLLRWKQGLIVTDAPYVLYLEDQDGDGRSDVCDTLLTGFSLSNPHVNVNNPIYGLDNWIYLAHFGSIGTRKYDEKFGDKGSEIYFPGISGSPRLPQNANGKRVRFHPDKHRLEMTASRTQFGHTFDRWGRSLLTHNQNHIYHEVIGAAYLSRNPDLVIAEATHSISDHGNETEVFQITEHPDRQLFTPVGLTTSSSGVTAYLGGAFPTPFDTNVVFVAESVSNLIHVDLIDQANASFIAKRHRKTKEFLASRDSWCRPVNMFIGPDGALYVLDYYRRIIEHPEWMSDEAVAAGGLYDGHDKGRIYRISPKGADAPGWTKGLRLGDATLSDLVKYLDHPNIWWRSNAQRLLVDKADRAAVPALERMAQNADSPDGRLHALWTLEGMGSLHADVIVGALKDSVPGIRENAIKLAELHLSRSPQLGNSLLPLVADADARVRFQLLCTLGFINTPESNEARTELLFQDFQNEWVQVAALSARSLDIPSLLGTALRRFDPEVYAFRDFVKRVTAMIAGGQQSEKVHGLLQEALSSKQHHSVQSAILAGLSEGLKYQKEKGLVSLSQQKRLTTMFFNHPDESVRHSCLSLLRVTGIGDVAFQRESSEHAASIIRGAESESQRRVEALQFLLLGDLRPYADLLKGLLAPEEPSGVQVAALHALDKIPGSDFTRYVLNRWQTFTPELRETALDIFLSEPERVGLLLHALETSQVSIEEISWNCRIQLMNHSEDDLRERARTVLTRDNTEEVNEKYQAALALEGEVSAGKIVYENRCASCHQIRGEGGMAFGPDLGTVHNWLPKDLMANIIDPNLSIAPGFDLWKIDLKDGGSVQGMVMSETSSAIRIRTSPGNESTIHRQNIDSMKGLRMSMMPGMAGQLGLQQMADLLHYLRRQN
jgi:putative membrane-bound dehydrogenase-like protein